MSTKCKTFDNRVSKACKPILLTAQKAMTIVSSDVV